ncbi:unnamed protein product, partial [Adineta steineri]
MHTDSDASTIYTPFHQSQSSKSNKDRSSRLFGIITILLLISIIILLIFYAIEQNKSRDQQNIITVKDTNDVCLSPYCIKAANYLLESIDETIDPCEDFYQFACGTWLKNTPVPPE